MSKISNPFDPSVFLKHATHQAGVYVMHDRTGCILYVGKAKNIKKRLSSYFNGSDLAIKTKMLVQKIASIEITVTTNETEALLLEQTLIKKHKPTYNICLRDDKSYPFICISSHTYPQISLYRGKKRTQSLYGPYPSASAAKESLRVLQKIFKVRQCTDHYFSNRSRPCLQYQINRCKAPCVKYISEADYAADVELSVQFLKGKSQAVFQTLIKKMDEASERTAFEEAARYRDQIKELQVIQKKQSVDKFSGDVDVLGLEKQAGIYSIVVLFIRSGVLLGHRHFMPIIYWEETDQDILSSFMSQFYVSYSENRDYPKEIVLPYAVGDISMLSQTISVLAKHQVSIKFTLRGDRSRWHDIARDNAKEYLNQYVANQQNMREKFQSLTEGLNLLAMPNRIECFDISHLNGTETVASCVIFNQEGALFKEYRRFEINDITPGDDYAALKQAVLKRYEPMLRAEKAGKKPCWPDLVFIDGGKGQLSAVMPVLKSLKANWCVYGVAKGENRQAGLETIINAKNNTGYQFQSNHLGFLLIQHIRNEAHRFALTGHRKQRNKKMTRSILEEVPGIGLKKRNELIKFFGGLQGLKIAEISDLMKVRGISRQLAEKIFCLLHN